MFEEIKIGWSGHLIGFYNWMVPTTKALREFVNRGAATSIFWGPDRQVDSVEDMLLSYRRNDNDDQPGTSAKLPVIILALARDMLPALDWGRPWGDDVYVILPNDPKARVFKLRMWQGEVRSQLQIFAPESPTGRGIAAQWGLYQSKFSSRRFWTTYKFAGLEVKFPVMIETPDTFVNHTPNEQKNLCILSMDCNLHPTVPFLTGPKAGEPNDGKGTDDDPNDPHGFPVVTTIRLNETYMESYTKLTQMNSTQDPTVERSNEPFP